MDKNKFCYKEVFVKAFVKYDNVQICVVCSELVEKVLNITHMMMKMCL